MLEFANMIILIILIIVLLLSFSFINKSLKNRNIKLDNNNKLSENTVKRKQFSMYVENDNGEYEEYTSSNMFPTGYVLNTNKSKCVDNNGLEVKGILSKNGNKLTITSNKTVFCYVYFDIDNSVYAKVVSDYENNNGVKLLNDSDKGDRTYDTYYYAGNITNNNVLYADHCWKMVITTEGNGVKMIYNGVPTDGSCDNSGDDATIGTSTFNSSIYSPAYVGYMYNKVYKTTSKNLSSDTTEYVYGNTFTYSNGTYTLSNTISSSSWSSISSSVLNNYHYTCFNTSGTCSSVYYIDGQKDGTAFFLTLTDGVNISDILNEMLYADDVNTTDSTIKAKIDSWYKDNLLSTQDSEGNLYSSYLQNTIYCNNREITELGPFDPDGGSKYFLAFNYMSLDCTKKNDQFTLKVDAGGEEGYGNNALDYPIGLISYKEAYLARNGNGINYLKSGSLYFLLSAGSFYNYSTEGSSVDANGNTAGRNVNIMSGVRPAVTLSSSVKIKSGDGSVTSPYVVGLS